MTGGVFTLQFIRFLRARARIRIRVRYICSPAVCVPYAHVMTVREKRKRTEEAEAELGAEVDTDGHWRNKRPQAPTFIPPLLPLVKHETFIVKEHAPAS
ncbi:hypothetical protein GYMLUDRAFT_43083 [Collybiopsis luxurians FD-317 M1]|uniref:Uncharacterized protein n=1 Tax=Collybiopsis luxurians FD-317 M1 TaxID=944289 RepID=A0A0D0C016_9AGAR|nr:hypothetical protein GYMLUDRAFT_43083 [Collybiopsis luxurians FD-317 M1]